jgi:hypothetical protein
MKMMGTNVLGFLLALSLAGLGGGCAAEPTASSPEAAQSDDGDIGTSQQALMSTGYSRAYYSDNTYSVLVGTEWSDCDPRYRELDGERSRFYREQRLACPGSGGMPGGSTGCFECQKVTTNVNGTNVTFENCTPRACSPF